MGTIVYGAVSVLGRIQSIQEIRLQIPHIYARAQIFIEVDRRLGILDEARERGLVVQDITRWECPLVYTCSCVAHVFTEISFAAAIVYIPTHLVRGDKKQYTTAHYKGHPVHHALCK